jgi:hypothetical protein
VRYAAPIVRKIKEKISKHSQRFQNPQERRQLLRSRAIDGEFHQAYVTGVLQAEDIGELEITSSILHELQSKHLNEWRQLLQ